jgi:hypothetical protein
MELKEEVGWLELDERDELAELEDVRKLELVCTKELDELVATKLEELELVLAAEELDEGVLLLVLGAAESVLELVKVGVGVELVVGTLELDELELLVELDVLELDWAAELDVLELLVVGATKLELDEAIYEDVLDEVLDEGVLELLVGATELEVDEIVEDVLELLVGAAELLGLEIELDGGRLAAHLKTLSLSEPPQVSVLFPSHGMLQPPLVEGTLPASNSLPQ